MNKKDLVDYIAKQTGLSKAKAEESLNATFEGITKALKKKESASFVGFGSFSVSNRKARNGRNPRTGAAIKIPASSVARFKPGKFLKGL
ncbi:MAG: HU family DNA-binding protein [Proteobacteria bacterium]|nr:HU family DNA-binding protein [Pseudomonadota bacterium]